MQSRGFVWKKWHVYYFIELIDYFMMLWRREKNKKIIEIDIHFQKR